MAVQSRLDQINKSIILDSSLSSSTDDAVLAQDAGRSVPLVLGTVLSRILATGKYVPFTDETATDGTAQPSAVYLGADIPAADLVAGDVEDSIVVLGGSIILDKQRVVIENSKLLTTVIAATTVNARTVEDSLNMRGIFLGDSDDSTSFEN